MGNNIEVTMNEVFQTVFYNISYNYLCLPSLNVGMIRLNRELQMLKRGSLHLFCTLYVPSSVVHALKTFS